jgi:hypothetical protein
MRARLAGRLQNDIEMPAGQRQFVHRGRHLLRQRRRCLAAQRAELLRHGLVVRPGGLLGGLQRVEIVAGGQFGQPRLKLFEQTGQRVGLHAVLARQPVHVAQHPVEFSEAFGVEVEMPGIAAQRMHRFGKIGAGRVQQRGDLLQAVVHRLHGVEAGAHFAELARHRRFAFVQPLNQRVAAFEQGGDVRQPRVLGLDLVPACKVITQPTQFLHCQAQTLALDLPRLTVGFCFQAPLPRSLPGVPGGADAGGRLLRTGESVEHLALGLRTQQRVVRMLAMDIEQEFGGILQLRQWCGAAVDEGARTAAGIDHAAQDQRVVVRCEAGIVEPGFQLRQIVDGEFGRNFGARRAAAHHAALGTVTQRQRQRIDQDGFSCAGLAGKHGETRREIEFDRFDQQVIADG